jgi:hypothetical protein
MNPWQESNGDEDDIQLTEWERYEAKEEARCNDRGMEYD